MKRREGITAKMKKISYYISLVVFFLIPIFPLIVVDSYFFPFITGKALYFRLIIEVAFASWIVLAFLDAKYRPRLTPLTIGVTLFAIVALLADLLGVNPLRSFWSNFERMEGWITIIHLWAFFMIATSLFGHGEAGRRLWHRWFNFSLFIALIIALYGVGQLFGWFDIHQSGTRLDASLGNSAYMAIYMLFHVFISSYLFFVAKAKKIANWRFLEWAYPILAILFAFIIFQTQTRGTILGLIGGLILALLLYSIFGKGEMKKWRWVCAGLVGFIVLLGVIFWFNRSASFIQNNQVLKRLATISLSEVKKQARAYIWPMALEGAMQRPILGWGQENFNYIFNANYAPEMYGQEQWFDRAHSVFLDWLVASGFIGLVAYLALYVLFLFAVWKSPLGIKEKSIFTGLLVAYAIHNVFVFDNLASYVLFFAMLGFVSSFKEGQSIKWLGKNPVSNDVAEYVVAPIVIVLLLATVYFFNVRVIQANTRLISALRSCANSQQPGIYPDATLFDRALKVNAYVANQEIREQILSCTSNVISNQQIPGPTKQAYFSLAMREVQAQITATPKDARIYTLAGSLMNQIGQMDQARQFLEKAHELSPDKQSIIFELASDYLNSGDTEKGVALLKQAYESAPDFSQARSMYAIALVVDNKEALAREMFDNDLTIFETLQMAGVYSSLKKYDKAITVYKKLIADNPSDVNIRAQLAQTQYSAGMISAAIATLRSIEKDNPELKEQIDATIKEIQK
jgi:O-antigen ligase/Flp pilus assembly protein TadD